MSGYIPAAHRMIMDRLHQRLLGGTHIHHRLLRPLLRRKNVQDLRKHLHCRTHRDGNDYDIALGDAFAERNHPVHKPYLGCSGCIDRIRLDAQDLRRKAPAFQVYRHRTAYQSETYNTYCNLCLLHITAQISQCHYLLQSSICIFQHLRLGTERNPHIVFPILPEYQSRSDEYTRPIQGSIRHIFAACLL